MPDDAVLLLNLGSPDSLAIPDVRRYLDEFLMDPRVIDAPWFIRNFIVRGLILPFRPKESAHAYSNIWTKQGSPLVLTSKQQQELLRAASGLPVYLAMRYRNPSTPDVVQRMEEDGVQRLFIIPLYPHYSMSSYETAVVHAFESIKALDWHPQVETLAPYYNHAGYIDALVQSARPWLDKPHDHLLFSFHGIPQRHLRKSDPSHAHCLSTENCCDIPHPAHATCYRHQCLETVRCFAAQAGLDPAKYSVTFQSRLGRDPWLEPYTDHTLEALPRNGIKRLLVICPAFVSDCLETLEEINQRGRESFLEAGGEFFDMIPCLNDHPRWIEFLSDCVRNWQQHPTDPTARSRLLRRFHP